MSQESLHGKWDISSSDEEDCPPVRKNFQSSKCSNAPITSKRDSDEESAEEHKDRSVKTQNPPSKKVKYESESFSSDFKDLSKDDFDSCFRAFHETNSFRFYLTKVTGLQNEHNCSALHIKGKSF
uniref:Uncharacterized protein n=1 Tax=Erpetoichthys calabaricus TaxID=27687 RepID=A0A8C4XC12_ERPCA